MQSHSSVIAITGGSRGIGAAIAERVAEEGNAVLIGYRHDGDAANAVAERIRRNGQQALIAPVDITSPESVATFFAEGETLGALSGVVASAGAVQAVGPLNALDPEEIRHDLEVNLFGAVLTAQTAIPYLTRTKGSLVLIGSGASTLGSPGTYVHYAAAKAGVAALAVGLSKELATTGVRVNCVEPGTVRTDFHKDPKRPEKVAASIPLGRPGEPEEIAGAVAWLLSNDASYATGAILRITGGL